MADGSSIPASPLPFPHAGPCEGKRGEETLGGGRAQSWGNRPQMVRRHRCSGPFEVQGPASSNGRNTRHVNVTCAAMTLHHLGAG